MRRVIKAVAGGGPIGDLSTLEDGASVEEVRQAIETLQMAEKTAKSPEDLWQRVENSYLRKLKTGNIVHKGSAIPSPIGMLFRNILAPSSSETGSMLKDPSPTFSKSP